jgi:hypothetical protein
MAEPSQSGAQTSILHVSGPGGTGGYFEIRYEPVSRTVELLSAYREDLPRWMEHNGVPLVRGKGTPTSAYATLSQMKSFGIGLGSVREFVLRAIHEVQSVVHFDWLKAQHPTLDPGTLVSKTHIVECASGHRIMRVTVDESRAGRRPIGDLMTWYERMSADPQAKSKEFAAVLERYERRRDQIMTLGFDIRIDVVPWR